MAKHTPGNWRAGEMRMATKAWAELHTGKHPVTIVQRGADVIAAVWDDGDGSAEKANAALIAEAPAMLAAIKEFCAKVDRGEARSKRSYAAFAEIIERIEGASS